MKRNNSKRFVTLAAIGFALVVLGGCGKKKNTILPPPIPPTTTNPGGGYTGGVGFGCGGVSGTPIGNPGGYNQSTPFYNNLISNYPSGNIAPSISLFLSYGQNAGSILGSAQLNIDLAAILGYATGSLQQQPVCASSLSQFGQTYGSGYQAGNQYFVIEQLSMAGTVVVPSYLGQQLQVPVQVYVYSCGQGYAAYVDLYTRTVHGCVAVNIGQQQWIYFQTQN